MRSKNLKKSGSAAVACMGLIVATAGCTTSADITLPDPEVLVAGLERMSALLGRLAT